jgi:spermidine synthase
MILDLIKPTTILEERNSKYNGSVLVKRSWGLGKYIDVGGLTQSGGILGAIWGSTLRRVRKIHNNPKDILILGLGGGTAAKLCLKYFPEAKVTGVDIDHVMVEMGVKYLDLPEKLVDIKILDAYGYVKNVEKSKKKYDLVLVDMYLGDNFPEKFGKDEFIKMTKKIIRKEGAVIFNRLYYGLKRGDAVRFGEKLRKEFTGVEYFYPEANLMLICSDRSI